MAEATIDGYFAHGVVPPVHVVDGSGHQFLALVCSRPAWNGQ